LMNSNELRDVLWWQSTGSSRRHAWPEMILYGILPFKIPEN
jgi:hypothetical protein